MNYLTPSVSLTFHAEVTAINGVSPRDVHLFYTSRYQKTYKLAFYPTDTIGSFLINKAAGACN